MRQLNMRYLAICLLLTFGPLLSAQEVEPSQVFQIKRSVQPAGPYETVEPRSGAGTQSCECVTPVNGALLICDDFESYTEGEALTTQSNLWRLWPGANRDALVDRSGRNKYILLDHENGTESDVLLDLGNVTSGTYELSFRLWTFSGTSGYFNIQHNSNFASNSQANWAYHVQFNNGAGLIRIGSFSSPIAEGSFTYTPDSWNTVTQTIDLDNDIVQLTINGQLLGSWQFSAGSLIQEKRLGAVNFFANDNFNARFAVDNVCFTQVDGIIEPKDPNLSCAGQGDIRVENTDLTITGIRVENSGEGPAEASILGYYLSTNTNFTINDFLIAEQAIPALAAGESFTFDLEMDLRDATVPDGFYYLGYILDYQDVVAESDEDDNNDCAWTNLRFQFITEERDPNLTCADPGNFALQDQMLSLSNIQIANNGNALASTTEIGVYLSDNDNISDSDFYLGDIVLPQMEPDTIISLDFQVDLSTFPALQAGNYFVGFLIDPQDKVEESNENDNSCVSASSFNYTPVIPEPNLYCKESG
ncbi:MAG: CARDB domain-containing protein, partial [Bacteroidota bacterium]